MICNSLMWSTMFVVVLVMGFNHQAQARSAEGLARIEKLLSSASDSPSLPSQPSSALAALTRGHNVPKRAVLDQSCKGIYDRELFKKLDRVCEDCYNLYRKPYVGVDCRKNCFGTRTFSQCVADLLLDVVNHKEMRDYLALF
uniref:Hyperglycemic hormone n=1 Tax=Pandalus japonicus TaxID=666362 RepID=H9T7R2_PANJP|nr:hyperglycemic hormone [Pandalus japonicus]